MKCPSAILTIDSNSVHRISMEYEKKALPPQSPVIQRKRQTPREPAKIDLVQPSTGVSRKGNREFKRKN